MNGEESAMLSARISQAKGPAGAKPETGAVLEQKEFCLARRESMWGGGQGRGEVGKDSPWKALKAQRRCWEFPLRTLEGPGVLLGGAA